MVFQVPRCMMRKSYMMCAQDRVTGVDHGGRNN